MAKKDIYTGIRAETEFVTRMDGIHYGKQAGSQATDIIMSHDDHGDVNTEMKGGPTVDHVQTRMDVDAVSGEMRQTVKSQQMSGDVLSSSIHPVTGKTRKFGQMINRHLQKRGITPEPGTAEYTRISKKSGKEKVEKRPAGMETVAQSGMKKLSLNNKNGVAMMNMGDDKVHVAIHHQTGKVALIPTSDEHRHLGDKMGLNKTVTYDDLAGDDHGHKDTLGLKARPPRAKGGTFNVSLETSSGNMVNAVDDAGGHVFDSLDHATDHLRSYGWTARSGHAMSESVGMLLQGKYHEAVALKEVTSKLLEYSGAQFQDKMVNQDLNTERDKDKESGSMSLKSGTGMRGIYGALGGAAAGALLRGKKEVKPEVKTEVKKDDKNDSGKTTPQETNKPSNTPPAQETVRAEPNPVTVSDDEKKNSQTSSGATVSPSGAN